MFDSKKAKLIAIFISATATAAIPIFEFSPKISAALAAIASASTLVVNFFNKKDV